MLQNAGDANNVILKAQATADTSAVEQIASGGESLWEIEKVYENDKVVRPDGVETVRVKWVGFEECTYEPVDQVFLTSDGGENEQPPPPPPETVAKKADKKSTQDANDNNSCRRAGKVVAVVPVKSKKQSLLSEANAKKAAASGVQPKQTQIDYMSHSLMPVLAVDNANDNGSIGSTVNNTASESSLSQLSNLAPQLSRRSNASRARKEKISIEEQKYRSAEMRDMVAREEVVDQNAGTACQSHGNNVSSVGGVCSNDAKVGTDPTLDAATNKALYYSGTDESDSATAAIVSARMLADRQKRASATKRTATQTTAAVFGNKRNFKSAAANNAAIFPFRSSVTKGAAQQKQHVPADANIDSLLAKEPSEHTVRMFERHQNSVRSPITLAMKNENWSDNSALENINDEGSQPARGSHVCRQTQSTAMAERNYKAYGINSFFRDTQFEDDVELERKLMGVAVRNQCHANGATEIDAEAIEKSKRQIAEAGFGDALVSVHSLCASATARRQADVKSLTSMAFEYPLQTDVRCFYDHHRFSGIPIFIPLAFFPDREMISILSSVCFCSLSCARSWIREKAPSALRNDQADIMLCIFARKYFGITEMIKYAESLLMHEDYGGPLNTRQWRASSTTHRSILRQPLSVAAPSTIVTEVYVRSRKDAGKVARIAKRTEETHFNAVPERPERNSPDAAEAAKRKLKEGQGRPLKQFQTLDKDGNRVPLDDARLEQRIAEAAEKLRVSNAKQPILNAKSKKIETQQQHAAAAADATAKQGAKATTGVKRTRAAAGSGGGGGRARKRAKAAQGSANLSNFFQNV